MAEKGPEPPHVRKAAPVHVPGRAGGGWEDEEDRESDDEVVDFGQLTIGKCFCGVISIHLKGQSHDIFCTRFFSSISSFWSF